MPRPSLVTSSGPSPVRGFIAAMRTPLPVRIRARAGPRPLHACRTHYPLWRAAVPRPTPATRRCGRLACVHARSALFDLYGDHLRSRGDRAPGGRPGPAAGAARHRRLRPSARRSRGWSAQGWLEPVRLPPGRGYALTDRARRAARRGGRPDLPHPRPEPGTARWHLLFARPGRRPRRRERLRTGLTLPRLRAAVATAPGSARSPRRGRRSCSAPRAPGARFAAATTTRPGARCAARPGTWPALGPAYDAWPATRAAARRPARRAGRPEPRRRAGVRRPLRLVHEWRKFLFADPGLPAELLPRDWPGHAAADVLRRSEAARLLPAAARFVDALPDRTDPSDRPDGAHDRPSRPCCYDVADGVATITLNRPDAMNSLDVATKVALRDAVERGRRGRPPSAAWCSPAPAGRSASGRTSRSTSTILQSGDVGRAVPHRRRALQPDRHRARDDGQAGDRRGQRGRRRRRGEPGVRLRPAGARRHRRLQPGLHRRSRCPATPARRGRCRGWSAGPRRSSCCTSRAPSGPTRRSSSGWPPPSCRPTSSPTEVGRASPRGSPRARPCPTARCRRSLDYAAGHDFASLAGVRGGDDGAHRRDRGPPPPSTRSWPRRSPCSRDGRRVRTTRRSSRRAGAGARRPGRGAVRRCGDTAAAVVPLAAVDGAPAAHRDQRPVVQHPRDAERLGARRRPAGSRVHGPVTVRLGWNGWVPAGTAAAEHRHHAGREVHRCPTRSGTAPTPGRGCATGTSTATTCGPTSRATRRRTTSTSRTAPRRRTGARDYRERLASYGYEYAYAVVIGFNLPSGVHWSATPAPVRRDAPRGHPPGRRDLPARAAAPATPRAASPGRSTTSAGWSAGSTRRRPRIVMGPTGLGEADVLAAARRAPAAAAAGR